MPEEFDFKKVLRWFVKEEVKTPLAFFFKVIPYMTAAWIAILYSPIPNETKFSLVHFSAWIFIGLCGLIAVFAFIKPRHLVYGESGHRAERKIELGTETRVYTDGELAALTQIRNPQLLSGEQDEEPH
jgi:hypothetical protein